jgi:hypothetical protein
MLASVPSGDRDGVWADIERELAPFQTPHGFVGPCGLLVASGTK